MSIVASWRAAGAPVGAHGLAQELLSPTRYQHARGVAQQSARLANLTQLSRADRRCLLAAAWLHDIGYGLTSDEGHALAAARALRLAGHEALARIVAHHSGSAIAADLRGQTPIAEEFRPPNDQNRDLLDLLDIADLTTSPSGAPISPAGRWADLVARRGAGDIRVRVMIARVAALSEDPVLRELVERVSPEPRVPA